MRIELDHTLTTPFPLPFTRGELTYNEGERIELAIERDLPHLLKRWQPQLTTADYEDVLEISCYYNRPHLVRWAEQHGARAWDRAIVGACAGGQLQLLSELVVAHQQRPTLVEELQNGFWTACRYGRPRILCYLLTEPHFVFSNMLLRPLYQQPSLWLDVCPALAILDLRAQDRDDVRGIVRETVREGEKNFLEFLFRCKIADPQIVYEIACQRGRESMAQLAYEQGGIEPNWCLNLACRYDLDRVVRCLLDKHSFSLLDLGKAALSAPARCHSRLLPLLLPNDKDRAETIALAQGK